MVYYRQHNAIEWEKAKWDAEVEVRQGKEGCTARSSKRRQRDGEEVECNRSERAERLVVSAQRCHCDTFPDAGINLLSRPLTTCRTLHPAPQKVAMNYDNKPEFKQIDLKEMRKILTSLFHALFCLKGRPDSVQIRVLDV